MSIKKNNFLIIYSFKFIIYCREESLSITLWGEIGENFDQNAVEGMSEPVIIAFTAMAAKQYLGKYKYNKY